jgi:hypothetical protein
MSDYQFAEILPFSGGKELNSGLYLWVWYADKIPPHIGCSANGSYFSLKVNGKDESLQVEKVLNIIKKKKILTLIIELDQTIELNRIIHVFSGYKQAQAGISTCLTPVIDLLGFENKGIEQLSSLLKYLETGKILGKVFGLNLTEGYTGIPNYGTDEIQNRLRKLENVQIKTGLPSVG